MTKPAVMVPMTPAMPGQNMIVAIWSVSRPFWFSTVFRHEPSKLLTMNAVWNPIHKSSVMTQRPSRKSAAMRKR